MLVQGIKALGRENVSKETLEKIGKFLTQANWKKSIKECRYVTSWVLEIMKDAAGTTEGKEGL